MAEQEKENFSLLWPAGCRPEAGALADFDFISALKVDSMICIPHETARGIADLPLERFFTSDGAVLGYRIDIVLDVLENESLYQLFVQALPALRDLHDLQKAYDMEGDLESSLMSVRSLEAYLEIVDLFAKGLAGIEPKSAGIQRLKEKIREIAGSEEYRQMGVHLQELQFRIGHIKSVTMGVNIGGNLRVTDAGVTSINVQAYRGGSIVERLRHKTNDPYVCMTGMTAVSKTLGMADERDALNLTLHRAMETLFARNIRSWEPYIAKFNQENTAFFLRLTDDLRFLIAACGFLRQLRAMGLPLCRPKIQPIAEKICRMTGVYNPSLAVFNSGNVVKNDFCMDTTGRFYLLTGPNHGGKSIFAYAVGMAQAFFQLGLPVPAMAAELSPVTGIYTHFPSSDEDNYGKGRLESECARLAQILKKVKENDLLLMDESLASTSPLEGYYIASDLITAIGVIGCGGIYVTHIHDLTQETEQFNSYPDNRGKIDNLVAQMQDERAGVRSFRIVRTKPDGKSYARDIANRYGLSLDGLLRNVADRKH